MKTDVRLSTKFLTTQNAHQVGMLVSLEGGTPVRRAPINVALVLDRSGSMSGMPLEEAKAAAARFASFLGAQDRLSVVVFDEAVDTIFGPAAALPVSEAERRSHQISGPAFDRLRPALPLTAVPRPSPRRASACAAPHGRPGSGGSPPAA